MVSRAFGARSESLSVLAVLPVDLLSLQIIMVFLVNHRGLPLLRDCKISTFQFLLEVVLAAGLGGVS